MRLSAERIAAARDVIAPELQNTPTRALEGFGCHLVLKDETAGPLACFKGRGADLFVATTNRRSLVCASAGNFGLALADAGRRRGVAVTVFVAKTASPLKIARIRERGGEVILHGDDFDAAKEAARAHGGDNFVEDGEAVEISEGAGTIAAELENDLDGELDAIVVPVGDGALIAGIGAWMRAHHPATRVIAACSAGAPVMRACWQHGLAAAAGATADTIADGIAVRVPVPAAVADLHLLVDEFYAVTDEELLAAMRVVHAQTGIAAEPSAVVGLAAIAADPTRFANRRVATVLTGANLTREQRTAWLGIRSD